MLYAMLGGLIGFVLGNVLAAVMLGVRRGRSVSEVGERLATFKSNAEQAANDAEAVIRSRFARRPRRPRKRE